MRWFELLAPAAALALDAFAVATVTALAPTHLVRHRFRLSFHFDLLQPLGAA